MGSRPEQVQARSPADHGRQSVVAEAVAMGNGSAYEVPHDVVVGYHQAESAHSRRHEPVCILGMEMERAAPDRFLILCKTLRQGRQTETGCTFFLSFFNSTSSCGNRSGRCYRMAIYFWPAAGCVNFGLGCPAHAPRPNHQRGHDHRPARVKIKMPLEFAPGKHALAGPALLGLLEGLG